MTQIFSQVLKYFHKKEKNKERRKNKKKKKKEKPHTPSCKIQTPTLSSVWSFFVFSFGFPQDTAYCIGLDSVLPAQGAGQALIPTTKSPWQVPK